MDFDEALMFSDIPAMSNDFNGENPQPVGNNNDLKEDEEEELFLYRGSDYRMVSIMKQGSRPITDDPYQAQEDARIS